MIQWSTNTILCWLRFGCMKTVPIEIFFAASMPVYLYPFLNTMNCERNYECLRLTSLGVIGTLAKVVLPHIFWSSLVLVSGRTLSLIWNFEYSYTQNKYIIRAHGVELIFIFFSYHILLSSDLLFIKFSISAGWRCRSGWLPSFYSNIS